MSTTKYSFESLNVWKSAREIRNDIKNLTSRFPKNEFYLLTNQIIRSSRSVTANLAEGYGRFHVAESSQFYRISRASLYETIDHLTVAFDEGYISSNELTLLSIKIYDCVRMLNGLMKYQKGQVSKE